LQKALNLSLSNYPVVPSGLRINPKTNVSASTLDVELAGPYHHYYLDTFGRVPPDPDPTHFEHVRFLMPTNEFRFVGDGLGVSQGAKRIKSMELGQAFCRWFLHEHLNITYFVHKQELLDRQTKRALNNCSIVRTAVGDAPDYFCAENVSRFFLGESKGRYTSIGFGTSEFKLWRQQFNRVELRNNRNNAVPVKGHIVATRFAVERQPRVQSGLYAEDPHSPGDASLLDGESDELGSTIVSLHYASIMEKLNLPVAAAALFNGLPLPAILGVPVTIWELAFGPHSGRRFVGGYYRNGGVGPLFERTGNGLRIASEDTLRLDVPRGTFFGVEEQIFRSVVAVIRGSGQFRQDFPQMLDVASFYSGASMLRDGSILAPVEFLVPVESATF